MGPTGLLLAVPVPHCHPVHRLRTEGLGVGRDCSQGHPVVSHEKGPTLKLVSLQTHPWAGTGPRRHVHGTQELLLPALRMCADLRPAELGCQQWRASKRACTPVHPGRASCKLASWRVSQRGAGEGDSLRKEKMKDKPFSTEQEMGEWLLKGGLGAQKVRRKPHRRVSGSKRQPFPLPRGLRCGIPRIKWWSSDTFREGAFWSDCTPLSLFCEEGSLTAP